MAGELGPEEVAIAGRRLRDLVGAIEDAFGDHAPHHPVALGVAQLRRDLAHPRSTDDGLGEAFGLRDHLLPAREHEHVDLRAVLLRAHAREGLRREQRHLRRARAGRPVELVEHDALQDLHAWPAERRRDEFPAAKLGLRGGRRDAGEGRARGTGENRAAPERPRRGYVHEESPGGIKFGNRRYAAIVHVRNRIRALLPGGTRRSPGSVPRRGWPRSGGASERATPPARR